MTNVVELKRLIVERTSQDKVAEAIKMDRSTLYRKLKDGGSFKVEEVQKMADFIPLSKDEAMNIFFAD